jgi:voltage-gated potassium channel
LPAADAFRHRCRHWVTDDVTGHQDSLRRRVWIQISPLGWPHDGLSWPNRIIVVMIIAASVTAIGETEPTIRAAARPLFFGLEVFFVSIFVVEYLARVWTSIEDPRFHHAVWGRLRYMVSFWALVDLVAILPVLLTLVGPDVFLIRLLRLLRILRLARLGRFSTALQNLGEAVALRRFELAMSAGVAVLLLVFSSTLLYLFEGPEQPDTFGSIPRAAWWSVVTLTTVGYGDVYPVTTMGRLFAAVTAVAGIGLIAMPTGILASAFSDVLQRRRRLEGDAE